MSTRRSTRLSTTATSSSIINDNQASASTSSSSNSKGKKRAEPEPASTDDEQEPEPETKKARYSLRERKPKPQPPQPITMPKKKTSSRGGRAKKPAESGAEVEQDLDAPGPSTTSGTQADVEMRDASDGESGDDDDEASSPAAPPPVPPPVSAAPSGIPVGIPPDILAGLGFGGFGFPGGPGSGANLSARLKKILQDIKRGPGSDATKRLLALQDLCEILSMSTEDTIGGVLSVDAFVKELVGILAGRESDPEPEGNDDDDGDGDGDDNDGDGDGDEDGDDNDGDGDDNEDGEGEGSGTDALSPAADTSSAQPTSDEPSSTQSTSDAVATTDDAMEVEPASPPAPVEAAAAPEARPASPAPAVAPDATPVPEEPVIAPQEPVAIPPVDPMSRSPSPVRAPAPAEPEPAVSPLRSPSPAAVQVATSRSPTPAPAAPIPADAPPSPVADADADAAPSSPPPVPAPAPAFNPADFGGFDAGMMDEDAALAAALAASAADFGGGGGGGDFGGGDFGGGGGGGGFGGDFGFDDPAQLESQLLACRCLANLMEALPGSTHTLVYHGAVSVLCSKLLTISYIDLAEQTLSTLEKMSEEHPSAIVREGGLQALLGFLDFFGSSSQRTALRAAGNCLRNAGSDQFDMVKGVWDTIRGVLGYSDARCVEYAALCVIRAIESFSRASEGSGLLDQLLTTDTIRAIAPLLSSGSPIPQQTQTLLLRALSTAARVSTKVTLALLEREVGVVELLWGILSGIQPPTDDAAPITFGDMVVMQNVAQRPKETVEEALGLVCEMMPSLPKDGIMDARGYTERSLQKLVKAKAKADRRAARGQASSSGQAIAPSVPVSTNPSAASSTTNLGEGASTSTAEGAATSSTIDAAPAPPADAPAADGVAAPAADPGDNPTPTPPTPVQTRTQMLRERQDVVLRFMRLVVPVLIEVYNASVLLNVRTKCVNGLLKALFFLESEELGGVLQNVPISAWAGGVLSSTDRPQLSIGALQIVELLLSKAPGAFRPAFRREGVLHEVDLIAERELVSAPKAVAVPPPPPPTDGSSQATDAPPPPVPSTSSSSASSKVPSDPQDVLTLRARVARFRYIVSEPDAADDALPRLRALGELLKNREIAQQEAIEALEAISHAFVGGGVVSSFEFVQSGLVEGLLEFATGGGYELSTSTRRTLLLDALTAQPKTPEAAKAAVGQPTAFATLVKRLQESLTRMENFEVVTVGSGLDDVRRNSASMLARQVRLRLVPDAGTDVPRGANNITISIHGLATFQALHDYMKPRIAGEASFSPTQQASRIARMLRAMQQAQAGLLSGATPGGVPAGLLSGANGVIAAGLLSGSLPTGSVLSGVEPTAAMNGSSSAPPVLPPIASASSSVTGSADAVAGSTEAGSSNGGGPRRSRRLSEKQAAPPVVTDADEAMDVDEDGVAAPPAAAVAADGSDDGNAEDVQGAAAANAVLLTTGDDDEDDMAQDFIDESFSTDVFQQATEGEAAGEPDEKTTNITANDDGRDGLAIHQATPHGTRVATPNPSAMAGPSSRAAPSPSPGIGGPAVAGPSTPSGLARASFASIVKNGPKPNEFHLEFSIEGVPVSVEHTVYGAVYQHEMRRAAATGTPFLPNSVWQSNVTVTYKRAPGKDPLPPPAPETDGTDVIMRDRFATPPALASMTDDTPHTKILRLLKVLNKINAGLADRYYVEGDTRAPLPENAFVNNKLTAKITRQLEEPMIVASSCLPDWSIDLAQHFPFLFPFSTRYNFLQSTSFGYARLIQRLQANRNNMQDRRSDDAFAVLGRIQRQKVRISRRHILESAVRVFELYGSSSSILEVEYYEEVGTGLGPTLEFYAIVSREFAGRKLKLWRDADSTKDGPYVDHPLGLFPAPIAPDNDGPDRRRVIQICKTIGQFVGKALLDSRIIDMSFNKIFMKYVLEEEVPLTLSTLEQVDRALAQSLSKVQAFADAKKAIELNSSLDKDARQAALASIRINKASIDDLSLDFTVPGYNIPLVPNGADTPVTIDNVDTFMFTVLDFLIGSGVEAQAKAFREGFSKVFPVTDLQIFTAEELVMVCGNADEDWTVETLTEAIKADHGFNVDSRAIRDLIAVMSTYDQKARRDFLQFITGSPKLPIGGFRGLTPPLTVVRKPHEAPLAADDYLPSVMTCVNYLKLPEYSSRTVLGDRLRTAMKEGVGSFHLS